MPPDINEYITALKASPRMGDQVVFHSSTPSRPPRFAEPEKPWPDAVRKIFEGMGAAGLYEHQAAAADHVRAGRHVIVSTPTASGKSLIYNLPVIERALESPDAKALYLFPLKALAQDQLRALDEMAEYVPDFSLNTAIYDGDTTAWHRRKIRENPPHVLMTNPEMTHLSLLPHHDKWADFYKGLKTVVIDEVHTYRGVMGSHMANVFRRFLRICAYYGAAPTFVFSSATVANPAQLAEDLTGLKVESVEISGAPEGRRHLIFMNPRQGPAQTAILLLKAALHRKLRTIVYAQSRKLTELISIWAGSRSGPFADRISAYRAGFLPEERREIEHRLSSGDLLAVISTSALELGIDVGDLDLCLLVGYPGTIVATRQRGGRVGRSGQDAAAILIAGEDALDQYFMRHPAELTERAPESAVINPVNPEILRRHLVCAARELPLRAEEPIFSIPEIPAAIRSLEASGDLLKSADGTVYYAQKKAPHRHVHLRGTGTQFEIICGRTGEHRGEIDRFRAFRETHPGAVYIHNGETYLVTNLDAGVRRVTVSPAKVPYYTRVRANKETDILEIAASADAWGSRMFLGRLRVTDQVTGYEKWTIHGHKKMNIIPLDLPPQTFETEGIWVLIPQEIREAAEADFRHFMGGIHAVEHAVIGIFPLLVMTDRNDLGGISTPYHPQAGGAAVFIYDGIPGGAGLTRQAFQNPEALLEATRRVIADCPCEQGCPSCVHSPKCGSGNRPIDKSAALFILEKLKSIQRRRRPQGNRQAAFPLKPQVGRTEAVSALRSPSSEIRKSVRYQSPDSQKPEISEGAPALPAAFGSGIRFGVLDIETRRSAREVGGWHRADRMGISCTVIYDSGEDRFIDYLQDQTRLLVERMQKMDLVIGFNIKRFDYQVLRGHSDFDFRTVPTLDILEEVHNHLGYRISLDHLARETLGTRKSADGLQALKWWKQGRIREIIEYCRKDVEVTRDLYLFGRENRYLLFRNKSKAAVRVPVNFNHPV